jgi:hypothetical protein
MDQQKDEYEDEYEQEQNTQDELVDALTAHFRRTSRGRIIDLPRWAQ